MRITSEFETQFKLGQTSLSAITLDLSCRDDITKFLLGLQHLSQNKEVMGKILKCLEESIPLKNSGRRGMSLWRIFILASLRQTINSDYDRLCNLSNNHKELRLVLGHGMIDSDDRYCLQTIKDNIGYLTKEVLDKINKIIVGAGHDILDKRLVARLNVKTDSFVVESNVHYPTDSNLLLDAIRSIVNKTMKLCDKCGVTSWRQSAYRLRSLKNLMRKATSLKRSTSKDKDQQEKRQLMIEITYANFISESKILLEKSKSTLDKLPENDLMSTLEIGSILRFVSHAEHQIEQLYRRIILKESIPHNEKVFSVFEEYTEWLCKGKAGVPVELGLKVCISSDQHGFILTHQVMQKQQDVDVAVPMINKVQQDFPQIYSASFDRGFYSKTNQEVLKDKVVKLIMPKKGKLSSKDKEAIKSDLEYQKLRRKHSAVESDINAIEVHALDRCPDRGIKNFRRYVSLAIAAHNIHKIGALVQKKKCSKIKRQSLNIRIAA